MTDYASFKHGAVTFPLPLIGSGLGGTGASLLRDADPPLFYLLEFYKKILETHLEDRFLEEVAAAGCTHITSMVAETLPLNPEQFLDEEHIRFPLLAAYRKSSKTVQLAQRPLVEDDFEVAYVLPPLQAGEAERLYPIMKAVFGVFLNRTMQGADPSYTPTGGSAGDSVWNIAGVVRAEVKSATFGSYAATEGVYFPCVLVQLELQEKSKELVTEFQVLTGTSTTVSLVDPAQQTEIDFLEVRHYATPTVTIVSPNSGTKEGGSLVTITGTNFIPGTTPTVLFGNFKADSVVVVNSTTIQCLAPPHDAFPTFLADVSVTNIDGQTATLPAAYTYTTP